MKRCLLKNLQFRYGLEPNQQNFVDSAQLVNKGGFNSEEKGENMNYGIWFSEEGKIYGGFESKIW